MAYSASKVWPSRRINFLTGEYDDSPSRTSLMGSPPLGMSASRLQLRLEQMRLQSNRRLVTPSRSRPGTTTNLDRAMMKDTRLRLAPSAWSNKQVRLAFQNPLDVMDDDDFSRMTSQPSIHAVPTLRSAFKERSRTRTEMKLAPEAPPPRVVPVTITLQDTVAASEQFGKMTDEERDMVTRLCTQALDKRRRALDYYSGLNQKLKVDSQTRIEEYDPGVTRAHLCDLMLQLVTDREALINQQGGRHSKRALPTTNGRFWAQQQGIDGTPHVELPVYCLDGITILGRGSDTGLFHNTFAPLSSLKKAEDDPEGFERYVAYVDMSGFRDDEILIHASGSHLRLDGCGFSHSAEEGVRQRRVTENIKLPKGVYPDRLRIGRNDDGILVIQEPWRF